MFRLLCRCCSHSVLVPLFFLPARGAFCECGFFAVGILCRCVHIVAVQLVPTKCLNVRVTSGLVLQHGSGHFEHCGSILSGSAQPMNDSGTRVDTCHSNNSEQEAVCLQSMRGCPHLGLCLAGERTACNSNILMKKGWRVVPR